MVGTTLQRRGVWLRRLTGALRRAGNALFVLVLAAAAAMVLLPRVAGWETFVVLSGSMGASSPTGSLVLTRPVAAWDIDVGDVIVVRVSAQVPVLHRVIERTQKDGKVVVRTKGDANAAADPTPYTVPEPTMVQAADVPYAGYAVRFLRTPLGGGVLAFVAVLLLFQMLTRGRGRPGGTPDSPDSPDSPGGSGGSGGVSGKSESPTSPASLTSPESRESTGSPEPVTGGSRADHGQSHMP